MNANPHNSPLILIVDDEQAIVAGLALRLGMSGYRTITATNGISGLAAAAEARPDLILLDHHMPEMDGVAFVAAFRAIPGERDVPIVMLSGAVPDPTAIGALGVTECLKKPYHKDELLHVVERVLQPFAAPLSGR